MNTQDVRNQKGFSLIELMIVVAIIGILATIAVPNFNRFQVKARQTEAKTNLAAIWTAEQSFFTEWAGYYGDFRDIGVNLEGTLRYNVGFANNGTFAPTGGFSNSSAGACAVRSAFNASSNCACINPAGTAGCQRATGFPAFAAAAAAAPCPASAAPTQTTFTATAHSAVATVGGSRADIWTMTQSKQLCNNQAAL